MPREAKKPSDEHGIRDSIEKVQKEKMATLVSELRELTEMHVEIQKPREFFKSLGEKLKSQNIDEAKFADFMIKEAEKSFTRDLRRSFSAFMGAFGAGESTTKASERKDVGGLGSMMWKMMMNESLVIIAECIKDARDRKMSVAELSEGMTDRELKQLMLSKLGTARAWTDKWQDEGREVELSRLYSGGTPQAEAKKQAEEPPIKGGIEKQQHKMKELLDELREAASSGWDRKPKKFFKDVGNRMRKEGIDEMRFSDFIIEGFTTPLRLVLEQELKVIMEQSRKLANEQYESISKYGFALGKAPPDVAKTLSLASQEKMIAGELLTIAICIGQANKSNQGVAEFFGAMKEDDAMGRIAKNRKDAEQIISEFEREFVFKSGKSR